MKGLKKKGGTEAGERQNKHTFFLTTNIIVRLGHWTDSTKALSEKSDRHGLVEKADNKPDTFTLIIFSFSVSHSFEVIGTFIFYL